jgi:hypothetical protein
MPDLTLSAKHPDRAVSLPACPASAPRPAPCARPRLHIADKVHVSTLLTRPLTLPASTCSSASSAVNVSLSDLDTPLPVDGVVAEAIAQPPVAVNTRATTPDPSSRPPRILERPGETSEEADRSRHKPPGVDGARAARAQPVSTSPFHNFPARALWRLL